MKKLLSLGFLSLSVVVLVACSQGKNLSSETSSTSEVKQETVESSKSTEASSKTDDKLPRVSADQMASFIDYFKQD